MWTPGLIGCAELEMTFICAGSTQPELLDVDQLLSIDVDALAADAAPALAPTPTPTQHAANQLAARQQNGKPEKSKKQKPAKRAAAEATATMPSSKRSKSAAQQGESLPPPPGGCMHCAPARECLPDHLNYVAITAMFLHWVSATHYRRSQPPAPLACWHRWICWLAYYAIAPPPPPPPPGREEGGGSHVCRMFSPSPLLTRMRCPLLPGGKPCMAARSTTCWLAAV